MGINGVNGKSLEVLFGGLSSSDSSNKSSSQSQLNQAQVNQAQVSQVTSQAIDSGAVKVSVSGENKSDRVAALKAVYQAGGDKALNSLYDSTSVAKAILG